jgi:uncharacterized damage-inducible protein DinB
MNRQDMLSLFQYNAWSTAKILEVASRITQEQFVAPAPFPHGSLRGTLVHALFGEWLWRQRWEGTAPAFTFRLQPEEFPTVEVLRIRWTGEETRLMDFVVNLTEERLSSKIKYISTEGVAHERVVWETLAHLVNHGTQHKTEAAAILTSLGHSPGDIDLIVYLNEAKG